MGKSERVSKRDQSLVDFDIPVLEWKNVRYETGGRKSKEILHGISGTLQSGHLVAIIGSSGAGKTTFLNTLAGRTVMSSGGCIKLDGVPVNPFSRNYRSSIAYVEQKDVMKATDTPREAIEFSAALRSYRKGETKEQLDARVDQVLDVLDLEKARDTIFGGAPGLRGLSGGEQKRMCIGVELVTDPGVIFLDEPTSGLDSANALAVIKTLKRLTKTNMGEAGNTAVLTTIHQPSSAIWNLFDDVIVLNAGQVFYQGPTKDLPAFLAAMGSPLPPNYNPSDAVLDLFYKKTSEQLKEFEKLSEEYISSQRVISASENTVEGPRGEGTDGDDHIDLEKGNAESGRQNNASDLFYQKTLEEFEGRPSEENASSQGTSASENMVKVETENGNDQVDSEKESGDSAKSARQKMSSREMAPLSTQFKYLVVRELRAIIRNKPALMIRFGMAIVLTLLVGLIFLNVGRLPSSPTTPDETSAYILKLGALYGAISFVVINQMFSFGQSQVFTFPAEKEIFLREYAANSYSGFPYFLSKIPIELAISFVLVNIVYVLAYFLFGLSGNFELLALAAMAVGVTSGASAKVAGAFFSDPETAAQLSPLIFVPQILFSGAFVPLSSIPVWLRWAQYLCAIKYGINLTTVLIFEPLRDGSGVGADAAVQAYMENQDISSDNNLTYALVLVGLWVGFEFIAGLSMMITALGSQLKSRKRFTAKKASSTKTI